MTDRATEKRKIDVLVVGAGAVGVCAAYYLSRQDAKVVLIDQGEICAGSSYGNAGLIVPGHALPLAAPGVITQSLKWMFDPTSPFYVKPRFDLELLSWLWKFYRACNDRHVRMATPVLRDLGLRSRELFDELSQIPNLSFGYETRGLFHVFNTRKGLDHGLEEARFLQAAGVDNQILTGSEIQEREPNTRVDALGGVYFPHDAHVVPDQFVRQLAAHVEQKGVAIHTGTEVLGLETSSRKISKVRTTRGDFIADDIVLAGGAWVPQMTRTLGLKLPIQAAKGYSLTFNKPEKCPASPFSLGEVKVAVTPMGQMLRFAGTLELSGLDRSISQRRVDAIRQRVPSYFPELIPEDMQLLEVWRGLRPCTPDGLPLLGRTRRFENLIVAAGHAMIGLSLSPITGKLVSQLVAREDPLINLAPLAVERFG